MMPVTERVIEMSRFMNDALSTSASIIRDQQFHDKSMENSPVEWTLKDGQSHSCL